MNILIFEYKSFGIEDAKETFEKIGHSYKVISTELIRERKSPDFDKLFAFETQEKNYDCVFTFNYSPIISENCNKCNIPYIAFVYDSPQILLYNYTIINPCNYIFLFDKPIYNELKSGGINTVYYMPLAVNTDRLDRMFKNCGTAGNISDNQINTDKYQSDISFVGSMYNEKHNLYDRMAEKLKPYTKGYLDAIMDAQMNIYGDFFIQKMLKGVILKDMQEAMAVEPNKDGIETAEYVYANYFLARKIAFKERSLIMKRLNDELGYNFDIKLYTPDKNAVNNLTEITNMGPIDYYNEMPFVFNNSRINLNISLRSIQTGIPLRAMDIMGAGGFLMSNWQADFFDFFNPGEDLILFKSHDDLISKCYYYLTHEKEREQIAANGYGRVKESHTYEKRFKKIFEIVFG